ncbi:MAG: hypothetical protein KJ053_09785 [Dehalococcoidia bacterium]|nr:hypothetical protein [Dehalococcoidia bacterium]
MNRDLPSLVATLQVFTRTNGPQVHRFATSIIAQLLPYGPEFQYHMHGDPGLKNDAFSVCVCHSVGEGKWVFDAVSGQEREVAKVVVDGVISWEPRPLAPVDLLNVDDVVLQLVRYYGIRRVTFDRWNSAGSIQKLIQAGILAEDMSFSRSQQYDMYRNLRMLVYNDLFVMPPDEDVVNELIYLKDVEGKIDHDLYVKDRSDGVGREWHFAERSGRRQRLVPSPARVAHAREVAAKRYPADLSRRANARSRKVPHGS